MLYGVTGITMTEMTEEEYQKILEEREKDREWVKFLDSILIELMSYPEENRTINYYRLYTKIASLRYLSYDYFRTTVFDCMSLLSKL